MIKFIIAGIFIIAGLFTLGISVIGIFRFSTMLNRVHVASKCDTMGTLLILTGLIIISGFSFFSLKLFLAVVFLWLCNPVASHLIARAEVLTNPNLNLICDYIDLTKGDEIKNDNN